MNILEYRDLELRYYEAEERDPELKTRLDTAKLDILPTIRTATGEDYGWVQLLTGDVFFYDVKSNRLEYFKHTNVSGLDTVNNNSVDYLTTYSRIPAHNKRMLEHVNIIEPPTINTPNKNNIVAEDTINLTVTEPVTDPMFTGTVTNVEWYVSSSPDFSTNTRIITTDWVTKAPLDLYMDNSVTLYVKARYSTGLYYSAFSETVHIKTSDYLATTPPTIIYDNYTTVYATFPNNVDIEEVVWEVSTNSAFTDNETLRFTKRQNYNMLSVSSYAGIVRYIRLYYKTKDNRSSWSNVYVYNIPVNYFMAKPEVNPTTTPVNLVSVTPFSPSIHNTGTYMATIWYIEKQINGEWVEGGVRNFSTSPTTPLTYMVEPSTVRVRVRHVDTEGHVSSLSDPVVITTTEHNPLKKADITLITGRGNLYTNTVVQAIVDPLTVTSDTLPITLEVFVENDKRELVYAKKQELYKSELSTTQLALVVFNNDKTETGHHYRVYARCIIDNISTRFYSYTGKLTDEAGTATPISLPPNGGNDTRCFLVHNEDNAIIKIGGANSGHDSSVSNGVWVYSYQKDEWSYLTHTKYTHIPVSGSAIYDTSDAYIYIADTEPEVLHLDPIAQYPLSPTTAADKNHTLTIGAGAFVMLNSSDLFYIDGSNKAIWLYSPEELKWLYQRSTIIPTDNNVVAYNNAAYYKEIFENELFIYKYEPPTSTFTNGRVSEVTSVGLPPVDGVLYGSNIGLYYAYKHGNTSYLARLVTDISTPRWVVVLELPYSATPSDHRTIIITDNNGNDTLYAPAVSSVGHGYRIPIA